MPITETLLIELAKFASSLISSWGYFGVFSLMALESTMFPLPSELVMPFAGYLAQQGRFDFVLVIIVSALGTVFGSLISYYLGKYGGEPFLERYGKYFLINKKDLQKTHGFFEKHGDKTIFISRFIPVVRHLISLPAGIAEMNLKKFIFFTFLGGLIWNSIVAYLGYYLGKNWNLVHEHTKTFSYIALALILTGIAYFIFKHLKK